MKRQLPIPLSKNFNLSVYSIADCEVFVKGYGMALLSHKNDGSQIGAIAQYDKVKPLALRFNLVIFPISRRLSESRRKVGAELVGTS